MSGMSDGRLILVTGGAASGKSALAETICGQFGTRLLYIAAMEPFGPEAEARIRRHRLLRRSKGFDIVERYTDLAGLEIKAGYAVALLEDTGNLVANEMFGGRAALSPEETVLAGIRRVRKQVGALVVVANEVFGGWERQSDEMAAYLRSIGLLHRSLATEAETVLEAVCGLPLPLKGEVAL